MSSGGLFWTRLRHSSQMARPTTNMPMSGMNTRMPFPASAPITLQGAKGARDQSGDTATESRRSFPESADESQYPPFTTSSSDNCNLDRSRRRGSRQNDGKWDRVQQTLKLLVALMWNSFSEKVQGVVQFRLDVTQRNVSHRCCPCASRIQDVFIVISWYNIRGRGKLITLLCSQCKPNNRISKKSL